MKHILSKIFQAPYYTKTFKPLLLLEEIKTINTMALIVQQKSKKTNLQKKVPLFTILFFTIFSKIKVKRVKG